MLKKKRKKNLAYANISEGFRKCLRRDFTLEPALSEAKGNFL